MRNNICSSEEIQAELAAKHGRIVDLLNRSGHVAVLISRHENIAWITAGVVDVRVGLLRETGPASLLITSEGGAYYITTNSEALRLAEEEFVGLGYEPVVNPWLENDVQATVRRIAGSGPIATDSPVAGFLNISLQPLRYELTPTEVQRYRWLGKTVSGIVTESLRNLRPGRSEKSIQSEIAGRLIAADILPSVYLTAVDDRIRRYKHAVPRAGVLRDFGMIGLCARRWGLVVSMTRFVHFGRMPGELEERFAAVGEISARLKAATQSGVTAAALFDIAREGYVAHGFRGQELSHHQGGATGYVEREWFARPQGRDIVEQTQSFAWNPNIDGAKSEDTILLSGGRIEVLTATPDLPCRTDRVRGSDYVSADVLIQT